MCENARNWWGGGVERAVAVSCALLAMGGVCAAHAQHELGGQVWIDYNPAWQVSPAGELFGDVGARTELEGLSWFRLVVRPGFRQRVSSRVQVGGGVGSFYSANDIVDDRWELRPWQGMVVSWPSSGVPLEHYVRIEQRIDLNTGTWDARVSLRGRYRVHTRFEWARTPAGTYWRVLAGVEGFLTLVGDQGQFREQFRVSAAVERGLRPRLVLLGEVMLQRAGWLLAGRTVDDLVVRIRFFQYLRQ